MAVQEFGHSPLSLRRSRDPGDTGIVGSWPPFMNCRGGRRRVMALMADDSFLQGTIRPWIAWPDDTRDDTSRWESGEESEVVRSYGWIFVVGNDGNVACKSHINLTRNLVTDALPEQKRNTAPAPAPAPPTTSTPRAPPATVAQTRTRTSNTKGEDTCPSVVQVDTTVPLRCRILSNLQKTEMERKSVCVCMS